MQKKHLNASLRQRLLVLVDESNVGSSVRTAGRGLDWLKLRDFLAGQTTGRDLIEMVVYAGLPPAMPIWQEERDKKNKFVQWLRSNGCRCVTLDTTLPLQAAMSFYQKHGYRRSGKVTDFFSMPLLEFVKEI